VPEILLSGDHGKIARWRRREALKATVALRPDLLAAHPLTDAERALVGPDPNEELDSGKQGV
jgi:tRNA (guanine37-N1)-methyltransferase